MGKNLKWMDPAERPAKDSTPAGTKMMDPSPGGGMIRNIKGPSVHTKNSGGDLKNADGIDGGTSVVSL